MNITSAQPYTIVPNVNTELQSQAPRYVQETQNEGESQKKGENQTKKTSPTPQKLSTDEERMIRDLQARDTEVRAHEGAHRSAGAPTTAASYTYQKGPDGRMYAIGGEVGVTMQGGSTPQETIANAQAVIAAAMAPAQPSPQDYAVASNARMVMLKAQQEKTKELQNEVEGKKAYGEQSITQANKANETETQMNPSADKIPQLDIAV